MAFATPYLVLQQPYRGIRLMYSFFLDALAALRLRFYPSAHYRYNGAVIYGILLVTGMVNAAAMAPLFGHSNGAVAFALCLTVLKWLCLSLAMRWILAIKGGSKHNWSGYVLLTEALIFPAIAALYWPQALGLATIMWETWIMVVQLFGFMRISQQNGLKVIAGYVLYFVMILIGGTLLMTLFNSLGWLDLQTLMKEMQSVARQAQAR